MSRWSLTTTIRARFGLPLGDKALAQRAAALRAAADACAADIDARLRPAEVALITGPSGSGKSLVIGALQRRVARAVPTQPIAPREATPVIELFGSCIQSRLRLLGCCGLADAHTLVTPAGALSDGQRHRLVLALAFERAMSLPGPAAVLADEFCSTLDRATAAGVALAVRRLVAHPLRLVCAAANDDLIEPLRPDLLVYIPLEGAPEILRRSPTCTHIPGRSCPSTSASDSSEPGAKTPGRSALARVRPSSTPGCPGFTTALPHPPPSRASSRRPTSPPARPSA